MNDSFDRSIFINCYIFWFDRLEQFDDLISKGKYGEATVYMDSSTRESIRDKAKHKLQNGILSRHQNEITQAIEHSQQAMTIFNSLSSTQQTSHRYLKGRILYLQAKLEHQTANISVSNRMYNAAAKLFQKNKDWIWLLGVIQGIAINYRAIGEYRKSLNKLLEAETIINIHGFKNLIYRKQGISMNIALVHEQMGDVSRAVREFEDALFLICTSIDQITDPYDLIEIIRLHLKAGNHSRAKKYLNRLQSLSETRGENDVLVKNLNNLGQALYSVHLPRLAQKVKAKILFEDLFLYSFFNIEYLLLIRVHVFNLLLLEYTALKNQEIANDMHNLVENMMEMAEDHKHYPLQIQTLILHAKFHFATGQFGDSKETLTEAVKICQNWDLRSLENLVLEELINIEKTLTKLHPLDYYNPTHGEFIDQSGILDYLDEILKIRNTK